MLRKTLPVLILIGVTLLLAISPAFAQDQVTITVWSQFASEPSKQEVIDTIFSDYMAAHPNVTIDSRYWDKDALNPAFQAAMLAGGQGAPDIIYFEDQNIDWTKAGWVDEISDILDSTKILPGYEGHSLAGFGLPVSLRIDMLFYNPDLFQQLGIEVPDSHQLTADQFDEAVRTCNAAGYAGLANAAGDRPYAGTYIPRYMLLNRFGADEFNRLWSGQELWDTPEIRQLLETYVGWINDGLYPSSYSSMGIDEFHLYFHTLQKSCMLALGNWYTGRAFAAEDAGGQSPDFHFSFLYYPLMDDAQAPKGIITSFAGFYGVTSTGTNKEIARDIISFMQQPQYGALWTYVTASPSALRYTPDDIPAGLLDSPEIAQWSWYWDEINQVYGDAQYVQEVLGCGDFNDALTSVFNDSLPVGTMTIDEAIAALDSNLCPAS